MIPTSDPTGATTPRGTDLFDYQLRNVQTLIGALSKYGAALDASDTGTGKTFVAVGLCRALKAQPAIICPLACIPSWQEACGLLGVTPLFILNYEKIRRGETPWLSATRGKEGYIADFEANVPPRTIPIFDEVQRCRGKDTLNTKMLRAFSRSHKTLMLSATPFTTPLEAFGIGRALKLFTENGYIRWCFNHGVRKHKLGHFVFKGDHEDMLRIHNAIFQQGRGVRTRREEIPGFPESLVRPLSIETEHANDITAAYLEKLREDELADYTRAQADAPEDIKEFIEPLQITLNLRARQRAELLKVPVMADMARDAVEKGYSVPIFLNFDQSIELMRSILKTDCVLRGQRPGFTDNLIRANQVRYFQNNSEPYIIVNAQAGGAGANLHDPKNQKPRHAIISPPWSAIVLRQILGRSQRTHGGYSIQDIVFAAGTVETRVMQRLRERINNLDALTDGDLSFEQTLDNVSV